MLYKFSNFCYLKCHLNKICRKKIYRHPNKYYLIIIIILSVNYIQPAISQIKSDINQINTVNKSKKPINKISKPNKMYLLLLENISKNKKIKAAKLDLEGSKFSAQESFSGFLPTVNLTADWGHERQQKHASDNTATGFHETGIKLTQLIYDFGKISTGYEISKTNIERTGLNLSNVEDQILLEGVSAYLGLLSAYQAYKYAEASETRIKKVYGTEEFRVKRGSGLASNLLQIRRRLASARRTTLLRQTLYLGALTLFKKTFNQKNKKVKLAELTFPKFDFSSLPKNLNEAIKNALQDSFAIEMARFGTKISTLSLKKDKISQFGPKVELQLEGKWKNNVGGVLQGKRELIAKIQATFPLYSGGKDTATYHKALRSLAASELRLREAKEGIEVQVTNNWRQHATSKSNFAFAQNEANIASEFLMIVKKERTLNKRSLMEELNAELALFSARSAANLARSQIILSATALMKTLGNLNIQNFK
jgi:adhesin transport system outer membrane protein